jgi:hypothetical protein
MSRHPHPNPIVPVAVVRIVVVANRRAGVVLSIVEGPAPQHPAASGRPHHPARTG